MYHRKRNSYRSTHIWIVQHFKAAGFPREEPNPIPHIPDSNTGIKDDHMLSCPLCERVNTLVHYIGRNGHETTETNRHRKREIYRLYPLQSDHEIRFVYGRNGTIESLSGED